jgi:zinc protease
MLHNNALLTILKNGLLACGLLAYVSGVSRAKAPNALSQPTSSPHNNGISNDKYRLESNSLEVILHQDLSTPVVAVNVWYHVGPLNESVGRTGFAHLFEHLMFQGSRHVADDAHFKLLERAGASQINGTTGYDRTNYFQTVPRHQLELALWLESDRMGFLKGAISLANLDNQRKVVMNERRQSVDNRPYGPSYEAFVQTLFKKDHPYYGAIIGSMEDLQAASLNDVHEFYDNYYAPANATLVVAGDIDIPQTKKLIQRYFQSLPLRLRPSTPIVKTSPIETEKRRVVQEPVVLAQVKLGWHSPPLFSDEDATADMLAYVVGAGKSSRLYRRLVIDKQLALSVSARQESHSLVSVFAISAIAQPGVTTELLEQEIWVTLQELRDKPAAKSEVIKARNMLITQNISSLQDIGQVADRLNAYNHYAGTPDYLSQDLNRYHNVTPQDIQGFVKKHINKHSCVVVTTLPEGGAK